MHTKVLAVVHFPDFEVKIKFPDFSLISLISGYPGSSDPQLWQPRKYIACKFDLKWFIGIIIDRSEEESDVLVRFMERNDMVLSWPVNEVRNTGP